MGTPARSLDLDLAPSLGPKASAGGASATGLAVVNQHDAASALLNPLRRSILTALAAPGSATTVAEAIGTPRQLVNYHLRVLERAGLVEEVAQVQRRGLTERIVRATAAHYLVAPDAIAQLGGSPDDVSDRFSATYQVAVAARTIREVAALATLARKAGKRLTTLSLDTQISFETPAAREAFGNELVATINALVRKYHRASPAGQTGRTYRFFAGAHPIYQPVKSPAPSKSEGRRKARKTICIVLTLVGLVCSALPAAAQTQPSPEAIQKMLEPMRPAAEHQELAALAGRWSQEVTYSMGGPPMKATGTVTNRMMLGGRFMVSEGSSPNPAGPGFGDATVEFMSIYGFDRRTKEFTIIGLDTLGTYYVTAAGNKADPRTVVMRGESLDDHGGSSEMRKYDMVLKFVDAETYVTEIIFYFPGRAPKTVVSVTHRRLK